MCELAIWFQLLSFCCYSDETKSCFHSTEQAGYGSDVFAPESVSEHVSLLFLKQFSCGCFYILFTPLDWLS